MGECIIKIFRDEVLAKKLGQNARWVAENILSWEKIADEMEKMYEKFF